MTNKEKQISQMQKIIIENRCDSNCVKCKYYSKGLKGVDCERLHDLESLINAGYGNIEQAQKETAKEILQIVREVHHGENGMRYRNPDCVIASRIKEKYGIEE